MEGKLWPPRALDTLTLHTLLSLAVNTDESSEEQCWRKEEKGSGISQTESTGMTVQK